MHSSSSSAPFSLRSWPLIICFLWICSACIDDHDLEFNPELNITPTCSDGLKNGDETAIDCGGACSDVCGDNIIADCSAKLSLNKLVSVNNDLSISISDVRVQQSYNSLTVYAFEETTDAEVIIKLPVKAFPAGNVKFVVAQSDNSDPEKQRASVEIIPDNGYGRYSQTGTLYLRVENKDRIHLEFCDIQFQQKNNYYDRNNYSHKGNINFLIPDLDDY